jgi:uncharacterized membrane protein YdjX (TVP38/TMEM64 family)
MTLARKIAFLTLAAAALAVLLVFLSLNGEASRWIAFVVNKDTHPFLFIALMTILPIFAFPISIFLILAGAKFGLGLGALVTTFTLPVHLIASFLLANSFLRPYLEKIVEEKGFSFPQFPKNRAFFYASLFVVIPGLPYVVKNYLLAMSGIRFRYYLGISWVLELVICIPVVGLGKSAADMNLLLLSLFAGIIVLGYLLSRWLKRRFFAN